MFAVFSSFVPGLYSELGLSVLQRSVYPLGAGGGPS